VTNLEVSEDDFILLYGTEAGIPHPHGHFNHSKFVVWLHRPTLVLLFEVFYVFFINFQCWIWKAYPDLSIIYSSLTKLNFYFKNVTHVNQKCELLHCALCVVNNLYLFSWIWMQQWTWSFKAPVWSTATALQWRVARRGGSKVMGKEVSVGGIRAGLCLHPSLPPHPGTSSIRHKCVSALSQMLYNSWELCWVFIELFIPIYSRISDYSWLWQQEVV
jgi:hypothetical protein